MSSNLGKYLKSLRKEKSLSQAEFGKELGFSARTVSDWENGNTEPNLNTVKAIVKFYDITYEELFEEIN